MAGGGGGGGGGGGTGAWRLEGEGGKAAPRRCGAGDGGGRTGGWDEGVLAGEIGDSSGGEHEEIILESMARAGRMGERMILQNGLVSGMQILKVLGRWSGGGRLSNGMERTGAELGTMGARIGMDSNEEGSEGNRAASFDSEPGLWWAVGLQGFESEVKRSEGHQAGKMAQLWRRSWDQNATGKVCGGMGRLRDRRPWGAAIPVG